jgi:hypothetical protein
VTIEEVKEMIMTSNLGSFSHTSAAATHQESIPSIYNLPKPQKKDYPELKFWYKRDYTQYENDKKRFAAVLDPTLKQPAL